MESAALPDNPASTREFNSSSGMSNFPTNKHPIHSPVSLSSNDLHMFDESFASSHSSTASASSSPSSSTRYVKERQESEERQPEQPSTLQQRPNVIQMPLHRPIPIKHNTLPLSSPSTTLPQTSYQPIPSPFFRPSQATPTSLSSLSSLLNDYWRRIALNLPASTIPPPTNPLLSQPNNNNGGLWIPESIPQIGAVPQRLNLPGGGREAAEQSLLPPFAATAFQPTQPETSSYSSSLYAMAAAALVNSQAASTPTSSNELAAQFQAALARQADPLGLASYQRFIANEQAATTLPSINAFKHPENPATPAARVMKSESSSGSRIEPKVILIFTFIL